MNIPNTRVLTTLINSLSSGVVPRMGLEHVAVGRMNEIQALVSDLDAVEEGGAAFRFIVGKYGSGKSFLIQTIRNHAMDRGFVVMDVDLSPERRLTGSKGQGLATYAELMKNFAISSKPNGGALEYLLQSWLMEIQKDIIKANPGLAIDEIPPYMVENKINFTISEMEHMIHCGDFAKVLIEYWRCYQNGNDCSIPLRWLRGEISTKRDAKSELNISSVISDTNWYDYIKIWGEFTNKIGYKGLVIFIDEGVVLYKISHSSSRNSNYEKLLTMFNDVMQGKASYLAIIMGGTQQFVEDPYRGLYSYEALRSRLAEGRFTQGMNNSAGPVLRLNALSNEEMFLLLEKIRDIHALRYKYDSVLNQNQLMEFMEKSVGMLGANTLITPREISRDFIDILNVMHQNEDLKFKDIVEGRKVAPAKNDPDAGILSEEFEI